jgi:uncharacterized protein (DUF433 family)
MAKHADRIDSTLMDIPHVVGRRISVIQLYRQITEGGWTYDELAEELELDTGDIRAAVEYYEANREEMDMLTERMADEKSALRTQIAENRPEGVSPP